MMWSYWVTIDSISWTCTSTHSIETCTTTLGLVIRWRRTWRSGWLNLYLALYPVVVITKSGVNTGCSLFTRPPTKRGESNQFIIVNKWSSRITVTSSFYASTTETDHSSLDKTIEALITFILIHNWKLNNL